MLVGIPKRLKTVKARVPAKGKTKVTDAQRKKIAAGKLARKTDKQIAADVDLHPVTVNRIAHDARTTTLILRLKESSDKEIAGIWQDMILGLGLNMKKHTDPREFNATASVFLRAVTAGDPPLHRVGDVGSSDGDYTLQELLVTMRQVTKRAS